LPSRNPDLRVFYEGYPLRYFRPAHGQWAMIISNGPDADEDLKANVLGMIAKEAGESVEDHLINFRYDPTNGYLSDGDLCRILTPLSDSPSLRRQSFDSDPGWDGKNNRLAREMEPVAIHQDFGYTPGTNHAGGAPGEIGGTIYSDSVPAYYAKKIPKGTLDTRASASGKIFVGAGPGNTLFGFFNSGTINEWRTPNAIVVRINARGEKFHAYIEFMTAKWRAGAMIIGSYDQVTDRFAADELPCDKAYDWSLDYNPNGKDGNGEITFSIGGKTATSNIPPALRADGLAFNRFGILSVVKSFDAPGTLWMDDLKLNGEAAEFSADPQWEGLRNRAEYKTTGVRPRFDFGYSPTHYAGGGAAGELGGLVYRGDCRYGDKLAHYGDRLTTLTLDRPLRASGKIALRRGVSDSTTCIGFYHSIHSMTVDESQQFAAPRDLLGACVEGPSGEGFYFYPVFRGHTAQPLTGYPENPPHIYPDGATHDWTLQYDPAGAEGNGRISATLDGHETHYDLPAGMKASGAFFDRFGIVTPWVDGNGQEIYFDDLEYTCR
ncbi:hypothetical protein HYR69_05575, partial [Candidatus Sumerlaeota bacterium]|nr:hypothetical protein [Candidatus Sumerlaeota bacterium]